MIATFIALLRGINVGGKNKLNMTELRAAFARRGFQEAETYINSGNVIFQSDLDENAVKTICEELIAEDFGLTIPVCVILAADLKETLSHAPEWWSKTPDTRHDAFFTLPPITAEEIYVHIGAVKEEYEKVSFHGSVIFWSAPMATYSRTRWSKLSKDKTMYHAITVRNANTVIKLSELADAYEKRKAPAFSTKDHSDVR